MFRVISLLHELTTNIIFTMWLYIKNYETIVQIEAFEDLEEWNKLLEDIVVMPA